MFKKPNTVPTPDELFDVAIKECTGSEIKLLLVVINKTFRWNKLWDFISISQFVQGTGLSHTSVIKGLKSLEAKGYIQSAYICTHCSNLIPEVNVSHENGSPSSECPTCHTREMPNKWYAACIEGEDLIKHLKAIRKTFNDTPPKGVLKKVEYGTKESLVPGTKESLDTGNNITINNIQETINQDCDKSHKLINADSSQKEDDNNTLIINPDRDNKEPEIIEVTSVEELPVHESNEKNTDDKFKSIEKPKGKSPPPVNDFVTLVQKYKAMQDEGADGRKLNGVVFALLQALGIKATYAIVGKARKIGDDALFDLLWRMEGMRTAGKFNGTDNDAEKYFYKCLYAIGKGEKKHGKKKIDYDNIDESIYL